MSHTPTKKLSFSYWSDPLCIWAYLAQDKLDRVVADFGEHLAIETRIVPVFGSLAWRFSSGPWAAGGVDRRVEETRRLAAELGHPEVSGECWTVDLPASSWAPAMAVKAVNSMERSSQIEPGTAGLYLRRLRDVFFVDNRNIAKRPVMLEVAEKLDIATDPLERRLDDGSALAAVWEDNEARERLKIQGSPTYLFDNGRARLYGNFSYGVLHATIEELLKGIKPGGSECSMSAKPMIASAYFSGSIAAVLLLGGCASHIAPDELQRQIESGSPPTIVDVRSLGEYRAGHVPGAIHLPFWSLAADLDRLPDEARSGPVVIYCEHGPRAGLARAQIWFADTGPIYYLQGHMTTWRSAGLPLTPAE